MHTRATTTGLRLSLLLMAVALAVGVPGAAAGARGANLRPFALGPQQATRIEASLPRISPDRLLVRFTHGTTAAQAARARASVHARLLIRYRLVRGLELVSVTNASSAAGRLARSRHVRYAVPDVGVPVQATPNDSLYSQQWALPAVGAPAAWGRVTGSSSVTVGVLDTGTTLGHPDLATNIWTNPDEIPGNGVDDDGNGYVDDVHGWNFADETSDPTDTVGHGTHVSGIIGAIGNNGVGVTGVNWKVRVMPLKVCNQYCYQSDEIAALQYAVDKGVRVANSSFGAQSSGYQPERDAIAAAGASGLLDIAAAGNNQSNNDTSPFYPASYPLANIISVAATDQSGLAYFSNYGSTGVDLAAPGDSLLSTLPEGAYGTTGGYGRLSGTSMAAPMVSGAAALLLAQHPGWTVQQLRGRLLGTARPMASLVGKVASCGQLDLDAATNPAVTTGGRICVASTGSGSGTVTSSPSGISCGASCTADYTPGTSVTLSAVPTGGSSFLGWSGACSGTGACVVSARGMNTVWPLFRAPTPAGWSVTRLLGPSGVDVMPAGSDTFFSFINVSQSGNGIERAKTVYHSTSCSSSDTGAISMERRVGTTWTADGTIAAPSLGTDSGARWSNCHGWGEVTRLSHDGSWLLASAAPVDFGSQHRCAAFAYHRETTGWTLSAALVPPGADPATGISGTTGCLGFGYEGAISDAGDRVAIWEVGAVDVFRRGLAGWALEQHIVLPAESGCFVTRGPRRVSLSGDGTTIVTTDPDCHEAWIFTRSGTSWTLAQTITGIWADVSAVNTDGSLLTVGATVYERTGNAWRRDTDPGINGLYCLSIVANTTRIVCSTYERVGYDPSQGAVYVLGPAPGGWVKGSVTIARLYAPDGFADDRLSRSELGWPIVAVDDTASSILAPIAPDNILVDLYPHSVIGYEFAQTPSAPPVAVSITDSGYAPAAITVKQGQTVRWTNTGTRSHTASDSTDMRLFFSGTLAPGWSYSFTFTAAGIYPYKSAVPEPKPLAGTVKVPLSVSPLTGGTATSYTVTWASARPPSGYVEDVQTRYRACATCTWSAWTPWKSGQSGLSAVFAPNRGKGMYSFRARIRKSATGAAATWSAGTAITVS